MLIGASSLASAVFVLPTPVCESTVNDGNVKVTWTFESEGAPSPIFHVIVFKQHTATADETFVLGQSNFDYIESTGTMKLPSGQRRLVCEIPTLYARSNGHKHLQLLSRR